MDCCTILSNSAQWARALQLASGSPIDQQSSLPSLAAVNALKLVVSSGLPGIQGVVIAWELVKYFVL